MSNIQPYEPGSFAVTVDGARDLVAEALGSGISTFQFNRVTVPAGGGVAWTVPSLEGDVVAKEIECIVAHIQGNQKAWWRKSASDGEAGPPDCTSNDGVSGFGINSLEGNPEDRGSHDCATCGWNQFGSARKEGSTGKDCKDFARLFLFRPGSHMPTVLTVPPTSLKPMQQYQMKLLDGGVRMSDVVTKIGLAAVTASGSGRKFSQITFTFAGKLATDERERVRGVGKLIAEALGRERMHATASEFGA